MIAKSIPAEYEWLRKYYPGHKFIRQSLIFHEKVPYDVLRIKTVDSVIIDVHFNIASFYGKGF